MTKDQYRRTYLLRLWGERNNGPARWRASLQEIHSETVRGFANVAELCAYLRHQTFIDERSQSKMDEEAEAIDIDHTSLK